MPDYPAEGLVIHGAGYHDGTVEATVNKNGLSGYCGLGAGGLVAPAQLGTGGGGAGAKVLADDSTYKNPDTINEIRGNLNTPTVDFAITAGYSVIFADYFKINTGRVIDIGSGGILAIR